jgi:hypothetical protein
MTNAEWVELLKLIPENQHSQLVIMLSSGSELGIEVVLRLDPSYVVFRGRALGNTEEGRVFFVPLAQIVYMNINRYVREDEIHELFNVTPEETAAPALPPAAVPSTALPPKGSGPVPKLSALPPLPRPTAAEVSGSLPRPAPTLPYVPPAPTAAKSSILERLRAQRAPRPK